MVAVVASCKAEIHFVYYRGREENKSRYESVSLNCIVHILCLGNCILNQMRNDVFSLNRIIVENITMTIDIVATLNEARMINVCAPMVRYSK